MPPKTITSYFTKPAQTVITTPKKPVATNGRKSITSSMSKAIETSGSMKDGQNTLKSTGTDETTESTDKNQSEMIQSTIKITDSQASSSSNAGPSSSPSDSTSSGKKRSTLSDAMRKAIQEGLEEGEREAKRAKIESTVEKPKIASIFSKPNTSTSPLKNLTLPAATSRSQLRENLSKYPQKLSLLEMELDTLGEDWLLALQDELTKPYFLTLKEFVTKEQTSKKIFPPGEIVDARIHRELHRGLGEYTSCADELAQDVYSWSRLCPLKDIRVVIVGQDPYHDDGQAHGLAFSVRKGMRIPPSLRNIYKQMHEDVPGFTIPKHGDLSEWAKHGVLLLNTSLTVRAHEAASHSNKGWEQFTAAVLKVVTSRLNPSETSEHIPGANGVVFMAWGSHAQKMCAGVDQKKHLILKSAHPSPLSAARGFMGNGHFKKANQWLEERYGPGGGIDWASLGGAE